MSLFGEAGKFSIRKLEEKTDTIYIDTIFIYIENNYQICIYRFVCEGCHKKRSTKRVENRFTAKRLPTTRLGTFIETRVNNFLRKKEAESGEVYIRVVFSGDKTVEVKNGMKKR